MVRHDYDKGEGPRSSTVEMFWLEACSKFMRGDASETLMVFGQHIQGIDILRVTISQHRPPQHHGCLAGVGTQISC